MKSNQPQPKEETSETAFPRDKRTSSEPLDMLFDDRDFERTETNNPMYIIYILCICRKESSVTSGLSSFPVQMNKPVWSCCSGERS